LGEEEHPQLLFNCPTSPGQQECYGLLASRFANNGFDEEGNLWNGTASWKVVEEDIQEG